MTAPVYRYLRGYSLDPGFSTRLDTVGINEVLYRVPFEPVEPGPTGEYLEVMDFDPATGCWYEPLDLRAEEIASQHGLAPSEGNPQFHQQLVYAVAMKTIHHFERALGRKIVWYPRVESADEGGVRRVRRRYVRRLRVYPHALRDANAYYDPAKGALLFGYFSAADQALGANHPGGLVFTCLSPDVVAHETTHAILDAIHHRYIEDTNPDVAAFHEAFADVVALLQRFTFRALVEHQLDATRGRLDRYSVLGELATQFGEALEGGRGALRGMIGRRDADGVWRPLEPTPADYVTNVEAHDRGAVLVATVFDAFQRIYAHRTRDLFRIASGGTGVLPEGSIAPDLVRRLAAEASEIAEHLLHICIRALDYCPPVDVSFGSYFRALITADLDIAPEDETGYRVALIEAFRARGIFPSRVDTLSVESLKWSAPEFTPDETRALEWLADRMRDDITGLIEAGDRETLYRRSRRAQRKLHALLLGNAPLFGDEWEAFLNRLGLTALPVARIFGADSAAVRFVTDGVPPDEYVPKIEVHTVRPAFRAGREGRQIEQVIVTLNQRLRAEVGDREAPRLMVFRGGCSLVMRLGGASAPDYVVLKSIRSYRRFREQAAYVTGDVGALASTYADAARPWRLDFNLLHRH
jgi:hypothetical protein